MKEKAILKINTICKTGRIITNIFKTLTIILLVCVTALTVASIIVPKDFFNVAISGNADIKIDLSKFGVSLSQKEQDEANRQLQEESSNIKFDINSNSYSFMDASVNDSEIYLKGSSVIKDLNVRSFTLLLITAIIEIIFTLVAIFFIGKLSKAFEICKSPFEENVIASMKKFAFSLIPWAVVNSIAQSIISSIFNGNFEISMDNMTIVVIVLVILALVYIFQYGAILQQESDETL